MIFEFDGFELDTERVELRRQGELSHVEPQVFEVLRFLIEHRDRVVSKEELLDNIWGDRFVSESALTSRIKAARQAVGDDGRHQRVIGTAHGRGYRFLATVTARAGTALTEPRPGADAPLRGRDADLARLASAAAESRIVTLAGPGGVGKTRLAIEFAARAEGETRFVDLSRVTDPAAVGGAFLDAFGVSPRAGVPDADRLIEALELRSVLVVVDNCEQVLGAAAAVVTKVVVGAGAVRVLATSRQALGVPGEHILVLTPLALPDETAPESEQRAADAVVMFFDRADRAGATIDDLAAVVELCRRLDGIPLALELAAARTRAFSPAQILEQLDAGWAVAVAHRGHGPTHHLSLEETIDWSYQLLDDAERALLLALAVFSGPFELAAVAAIVDVDLLVTADRLAQLVDKSLLQSVASPAGRRFRLLETVRAFTAARLDADHAAALRDRHAGYFATEVGVLGARVPGPDEDDALARLGAAIDDVHAAFMDAVIEGDVDTAARLASGPRLSLSPEGARWAHLAGQAVTLPGIESHPDYVSLLASAAWGAVLVADLPRSRDLARTGIAIVGDPAQHPRLCWIWPQATAGSYAEGAAGCVEGAAVAHDKGDTAAESFLLGTAAIYRIAEGDERAAVSSAERARELAHEVGSRSLWARAAGALAYALQDLDASAAGIAAHEVLDIAQPGDFHLNLPHRVLATLAWRAGDRATAAAHERAAVYLIRDQGDRYVQAASMRQLAVLVGDVDALLAAELLGIASVLVPEMRVIKRDEIADKRLRAALAEQLGAGELDARMAQGGRLDVRGIYATVERALRAMAGDGA